MEIKFPPLTTDDIEVRVGQTKKDGSGFSLLLYKTARTDAKYLDQVVGCLNWQKKFYLLDKTLYCSVGIYHDERKEWVWKDDCGSETQVEAEKGQSSDAFKRAGFAWGIGRELYSAPVIWVKITQEITIKTKFVVKSIDYDKNNEIKSLEIATEKGELVFSYGLGKKVAQTSQKEPKQKDNDGFVDLHNERPIQTHQLSAILDYALSLSDERKSKFDNWLDKEYGVKDFAQLTEKQANEIIEKYKIGGNQ